MKKNSKTASINLRGILIPLVIFLSMNVNKSFAQEKKVIDIWFNAFIANSHPNIPNYIKKAANGIYVLDAPNLPIPRSLPLGNLSGTCFSTDQRGFSDSIDASSRVSVRLRIVVQGRSISVEQIDDKSKVFIGKTHNVDCKTGKELGESASASVSSVSISEVRVIEFARTFSIRASAGNPFYSLHGLPIAPRIDYDLLFVYDIKTKNINITGTYGYFPWFEGYYRIGSGNIRTIIKQPPDGNSTATSLLDAGTGINMRNFQEKIDPFGE